jgi:amino acid transporter
MIKHEHHSQTSIIERAADYKPPRTLRSWFIGRPLSTADAPHQTIGKAVGLAVFASDALSSTAYASQEILAILIAAGSGFALQNVFPISIAIVILLAIVAVSYEQTIHAYPDGGGAYIVARDNLGELPAQTAGAALLTDYILTVAVSVAAGVAQIVSAYPSLFPYRVLISVIAILFITLINLRGVKESGTAFAIPTYFFIIMMFMTVGIGMARQLSGGLGTVLDPPHIELGPLTLITPFLFLHAFSSGTAALTGIEAISNGITAFKEPRSKNAGITLIWMAVILSTFFLGISYLAGHIGAVPSEEETVISQLARTVFNGRGVLYLMTIGATTIILIMAANTAFADFPRLGALIATDGFLPRQLAYRGSRLVYSRGIIALAVIASIILIIFKASVTRLIPLYAIGVFLSFTLSQGGMALRWYKIGKLKPGEEKIERGSTLHSVKDWPIKMVINGLGAACTATVMVVFASTKFYDGAWVVLILIPVLITIFLLIHRHYNNLARKLSLDNFGVIPSQTIRHRVIMPVSGVHQGTLAALRYARMLSNDVTAVHVSIEPAESEKVRQKWETWGEGVRMVILDSPYRLFLEPLLAYIAYVASQRQPGETITVVVPEFVSENRLTGALHTNTANLLRTQLKNQHGIVITNVPYHVHEKQDTLI